MRLLKFLIPFILVASTAFSQTTPPPATPAPVEPPLESLPPEFREVAEEEKKNGDAFTSGLLKMLMTLGMMIALIYIISYMLKKAMNKNQMRVNETSGIKILESRSLSQRTAIYLVEIEGKEYVLAESTNGVTLLDNAPRATKE